MGGKQPNDMAAYLARAAGRFSSDKALRKRLLSAGASSGAKTLLSVTRVLRTLWLEMTGFLFICLSVIGGAEVVRKWHTHETAKLAAAAAFSVMFAYFGVTSFWRVRKSKSQRGGAEARRKA